MTKPSLRDAERTLSKALQAIDDWHAATADRLPVGHTWADIERLEIERCDRAIKAHDEFKRAAAEFKAYVASHADDEDER
jgi:hypothetical protein